MQKFFNLTFHNVDRRARVASIIPEFLKYVPRISVFARKQTARGHVVGKICKLLKIRKKISKVYSWFLVMSTSFYTHASNPNLRRRDAQKLPLALILPLPKKCNFIPKFV